MRGCIRPQRPFKGYNAIKSLERPGGGPREGYLRVLHEALKGGVKELWRAPKAILSSLILLAFCLALAGAPLKEP